jgi:hypothetical protein
MDKSNEYIIILKEIFDEYQSLMKRASSNIDQKVSPIFIVDELQGIFAWLDFGWTKQGRTKSINVFVRLKDGKIHIEEDWTEEGIATDLLREGVPKKDIVLAFHEPSVRQYTEFAIA